MPSRLSSLLVSDGVVSVKRMEHAFQRQVIYGGSLDTILLEMNLVSEARLVQYLSKATSLPPATPQETAGTDTAAAERCPAAVADRYRVVPLCFSDSALRLLVHDPVEMAGLEELANELGVAVQPLVVPEYRFHLTHVRVFGGTPDARYETLARRADESRPLQPVGKARSVIVDAGGGGGGDTERTAAAPTTIEAAAEVFELPAPKRREKRTMEMASAALARRSELDLGNASPVAPTREQRLGHLDTAPVAATDSGRESPANARARAAGPDTEALSAEQAIAALPEAEDRDIIFNLLLRAVRHWSEYAALFTVQGQSAIGRIAIDGDRVDRMAIARAVLPLDMASPFRTVAQSLTPYAGPLRIELPGMNSMLADLGIAPTTTVVLVPVILRGRVVAIALGHGGAEPVSDEASGALMPVTVAAADAISRLIVKAKSQRQTAVTAVAPPPGQEPAAAPAPDAEADTDRYEGLRRRPERSTQVMAHPPIDSVLSAVQSENPEEADYGRASALARPDETLSALAARFPGTLWVERFELEGQPLPPAEHGPLLALTIELGPLATEMLIEKLADPDREIRYYAALCLAETRPREALEPFVEHLFDSDYGIRSLVIDALSDYPAAQLEKALARVRQALHSDQGGRVQAAGNALAKLGDTHAVPVLIDVMAEGGSGAEHARRTLISLTRQDFASSVRKWRSWWNKHQEQHMIEWLIDALGHKDENLRGAAAEDLRQRTGEYFGFHHDLSKREREQAQQRWREWWRQTGSMKFAGPRA